MVNGAVVYESDQPISYLMVLDFEANCVKDGEKPLKVQEIIEFPVVLVNVKTKKVEDVFHHYVKPQVVPKLSDFCTELTGITQEKVDKEGIPLENCIKEFEEFLAKKAFRVLRALMHRRLQRRIPCWSPAGTGTSRRA